MSGQRDQSSASPPAGRVRWRGRTTIPAPLAGEVPRPILDRLLDDAVARRLTLVTAGPGWGKTTAVAAWARRSPLRDRLLWVTLGAGDDAVMAFWSTVVAAIQARGLLESADVPLLHLAPPAAIPSDVLPALYRALARSDQPIVVVLDDFQVIEDPDVLATVADALAMDLPLHLVLLGRSDPALPLHRLRLAGDLVEVDSGPLSFDVAEVVALAAALGDPSVTCEVAEQVLVRTHGWPVGVRLALLYQAHHSAAPDPLSGFGGSERSVSEYLVAEVVTGLDADDHRFLQRTSIVDPVTADLADSLVPGASAQMRLERLERANLFVTAADESRDTYRYHPLMRDLLRHSLRRDDPQTYLQCHGRAAAWLARHGDPVTAIDHAVAARDWDRALECALAAAPSLVDASRFRLYRALSAIPFDELPPSPQREISAAGLDVIAGNYDAVAARLASAREMTVDDPVRLPPGWRALLENLTAATARIQGDLAVVLASAEWSLGHLASAVPGPAIDGQRQVASAQRAIALLWQGRLHEARSVLAESQRTPASAPTLVVASVAANSAWCDCLLGRLDEARSLALTTVARADRQGWTPALQLRGAYLSEAMVALLRGQHDDADQAIARGLAATAGGVELWPEVTLHLLAAAVAVSRRRPRGAHAARDVARRLAEGHAAPPTVAPIACRVDADLALLDPSPPGTSCPPGSSAPPRPATDPPWGLVASARLSMARSDTRTAAELALAAAADVGDETLEDTLIGIDARIVLALAADRDGQDFRATDHIRQAIDMARDLGITRPFATAGSDRVGVLVRRLTESAPSPDPHLRAVASQFDRADHAGAEPAPLLEPLSDRELAVLAQLPTMRNNSEIGADLFVSVNTIKMHLKQVYRKLGVSSRRDAVRRARDLGLLR